MRKPYILFRMLPNEFDLITTSQMHSTQSRPLPSTADSELARQRASRRRARQDCRKANRYLRETAFRILQVKLECGKAITLQVSSFHLLVGAGVGRGTYSNVRLRDQATYRIRATGFLGRLFSGGGTGYGLDPVAAFGVWVAGGGQRARCWAKSK